MNGRDFDDPERVQWTQEEYQAATWFGKWRAKNQWWLSLFVYGGFGMIGVQLFHGFKLSKKSQRMRWLLTIDLLGICAFNGILYFWLIQNGLFLKYLLFFIIIERSIGFVHQLRSHIEHYGLWGNEKNPLDGQVFSSRNIRTGKLTSWFFNRLNFHSVHHAFPRVPFYNLRKAHQRFVQIYKKQGRQLVENSRYSETAWRLATHPTVISRSGDQFKAVFI